jgi:hypothetical protein
MNDTRSGLVIPIYRDGRQVHLATVTQWNRAIADDLAETFPNCYVRSQRETWPLKHLGNRTIRRMRMFAVAPGGLR